MKISRKEIWAFFFLLVFLIILYLSFDLGFLARLDISLNQAIPAIQNDFSSIIGKALALIFDTYCMIVISFIVALIFWIKKYKKEAIFFASTILVNAGAIYLMKNVVERLRPLNGLIAENGFAFPSGHAMTAVVFFGMLIYLTFIYAKNQKMKIWVSVISFIMILLIGFSRLYLNVHWLSDVLGGFALGAFILFLGISVKEIFD